MITAKEARGKVDALKKQDFDKLLSECEENINLAIEQREYSICFETELSDERTDEVSSMVKKYLESAPYCYKVKMMTDYSSEAPQEGHFDPLVMKIEIKW